MPRGARAASIAVLGALAAAQLTVLLMRPRSGVIAPAPVEARDWFTPAQLERALDFREPQLALAMANLAVEAGVLALVVVAARRDGPLGRRLRHPRRRPVAVAACVGGALSLAVTVAQLPLGAILRQRSIDVGLTTRGWPGWAWDLARSAGIGALFAAVATAAGIALMRRLPRTWWIPASVLIVLVGAGLVFAKPLVIDPVFNRFEPLPAGPTRTAVVALAARAGVDVGDVLVVDASKRTTAANAYVTGLGGSKRVVLYDTLLEDFDPDETRLVVAHELAHVRFDDVPRALLFLAIVAPLALLAVHRLTAVWAPRGDGRAGPATVPALVAAVTLMTFTVTLVSNQLSRRVEARADSYALELTGEARPFIAKQRSLALQNVADPDPPALVHALFGTHPTTVQRIGIGEAYERRRAARSPRADRPRDDRPPEGS